MKNFDVIGQQLLANGQYGEYIYLVEEALDASIDEDIQAKLVGLVFEHNIAEGYWLIPEFVERHPNSLQVIRVYLADLWAQQGKFDAAANEARIYLWMMDKSELLNESLTNPILLEGVARAYLLLTSVYTEIGARSYSNRVLKKALNLPLPNSWKIQLSQEISNNNVELNNKDNIEKNNLWEHFFLSGENVEQVIELCNSAQYFNLKKRLELISDNFNYNKHFTVNEIEQLMIVRQTEQGYFSLE